mmetsp:Transcript_3356/g.7399  ORF Transcript_3356/g.7399 Transcript_3356/m.7399 type:complete len:200 (+) Transcript_3356:1243-1842(+)
MVDVTHRRSRSAMITRGPGRRSKVLVCHHQAIRVLIRRAGIRVVFQALQQRTGVLSALAIVVLSALEIVAPSGMVFLAQLEDGTHPFELMRLILAEEVEFLPVKVRGAEVDLQRPGGTPRVPLLTHGVVIPGEHRHLRLRLIRRLLQEIICQFVEGKSLLLEIFLGIFRGAVRQKVRGVVDSMIRKNKSGKGSGSIFQI